MMVMTLPWHYLGLQGQWRRVATFDYTNPLIAPWGKWVVISLIGGIILLISAGLFVYNLVFMHRAACPQGDDRQQYALALHPPPRTCFTQWLSPMERIGAGPDGPGLWLSNRTILHKPRSWSGRSPSELTHEKRWRQARLLHFRRHPGARGGSGHFRLCGAARHSGPQCWAGHLDRDLPVAWNSGRISGASDPAAQSAARPVSTVVWELPSSIS